MVDEGTTHVLELLEYSSRSAMANDSLFRLPKGEDLKRYADCAVLPGDAYRQIFGDEHCFLPIVKINYNGKSLYRRFCGNDSMKRDFIALSQESLKLLESDIAMIRTVELSRGSLFNYYWHHPLRQTRLLARISMLTIPMAAVLVLFLTM